VIRRVSRDGKNLSEPVVVREAAIVKRVFLWMIFIFSDSVND